MSEQINSKRLIFPKGEQAKFLMDAKERLNISWPKFAGLIPVHPRTLNDWKREDGSLPAIAADKISELSGIQIPSSVETREAFWYTSENGKKSGKLLYEKYGRIGGDPEYRKQQWEDWWEKSGHKNNLGAFAAQKEIEIPSPSVELAELAGIILGDGCITKRQVKVTLDTETDAEYFSFVKELFTKLFGITPSIRKIRNARAANISISRTKLVEFWTKMGIPPGNKVRRQAEIPDWINEKAEYQTACVRGLVDTDGCIFNETHTIKGKKYSYLRLSFVNMSQPLLNSVYEILNANGFSPKIRGKRAVVLEKRENVIRYFKEIGTHNPKHAKRFANFSGGVA